MDGISTLERLKKDSPLRDIPVIGITSSMDPTYPTKAFRAGAEFFLPKPFDMKTLISTVELAVTSGHKHQPH